MQDPNTNAMPFDLAFLLKAANYEAGEQAGHFSKVARDAVDLAVEQIKATMTLKLELTRARLKLVNVEQLAKVLHDRGEDIF